jgi:hypothetical protein
VEFKLALYFVMETESAITDNVYAFQVMIPYHTVNIVGDAILDVQLTCVMDLQLLIVKK